MDENFDHKLVISDTKNKLYTTIVNRRETFMSISRFVMQMMSFLSFIVCLWIFIFTRQLWYVWWIIVFFLLALANTQVLNYRIFLDVLKQESTEDDDELDDLA